MTVNSTQSLKKKKQTKLPAGFCLKPHRNGQYYKYVNGAVRYFGKIDNPKDAWDRYLFEKPYLESGRDVPDNAVGDPDALTIGELTERFQDTQKIKVDAGELASRTYRDYVRACDRLRKFFRKGRKVSDLRPRDFEDLKKDIAAAWGPVPTGNEIGRIRTILKYAYDMQLIDRAVSYGRSFDKPKKSQVRKHHQAKEQRTGKRLFSATELRTIIDNAPQPLKAMVLLACQSGMGQTDVSSIPISCIDLQNGFVDFPRVKTAVDRSFPLWPETTQALNEAAKCMAEDRRGVPDENDQHLFFLTPECRRWVNPSDNGTCHDRLGKWFTSLLKDLKIWRPGLSFYALRHTFQTEAEESGDFPAVGHIMGHSDSSMSGRYRRRISAERLQKVIDIIHSWLFTTEEGSKDE